MRMRNIRAVSILIVLVGMILVVKFMSDLNEKSHRVRGSEHQLKMLYEVLLKPTVTMRQPPPHWDLPKEYPYYVFLAWPPLSRTLGQLAPESTGKLLRSMKVTGSNYWNAAFISSAHPDAEQMRLDARVDLASAFTDDSFWYLAYSLPNEEAGLAFVEAYRKAIQDTGEPPVGDIGLAYPIVAKTIAARNSRTEMRPAHVQITIPSHQLLENTEGRDETTAPEIIMVTGRLPILIERPGLRQGGSSVLFQDGHVEFMEYPGEWPMTERFIKALKSLDELKATAQK